MALHARQTPSTRTARSASPILPTIQGEARVDQVARLDLFNRRDRALRYGQAVTRYMAAGWSEGDSVRFARASVRFFKDSDLEA